MIGLDTDVLVYGEALEGGPLQQKARLAIEAALREGAVVPAQVLAEMYRVLLRKAGMPVDLVRARIERYEKTTIVAPTLGETLSAALDLASTHRLQIFDAIILAATAEAECRMLLSEDMQDGFVWHGVTVVNPFAATPHPMLQDLLRRGA